MATEKLIIADLKVHMDIKYDLLRSRCEKYLHNFSGEPDIVVNPSQKWIDNLVETKGELTHAEYEYLCAGLLFYDELLKFDGFVMHSSSLCYNNKAYLFSADSGTGKSTHVGLWKKYIGDAVSIINDDKPAVRLIDGKFYCIGTPFSGKTDQNLDISVPVGAMALLYRGIENKIEPAETRDAVHTLLRQTLISINNRNNDRLIELLDLFVKSVPIYRFGCDMSEEAVKTSFEKMTGEKYFKG